MKPRHLVAAFLSLPFLYLFASGPAMGLAERSIRVTAAGELIDDSGMFGVIATAYDPLISLANRSQTAMQVFNWYVNLWKR
ncbi:MAG TPA: hypothetical protein VK961_00990 [Chthoniobacter sp.]|nr:hypothetical protein [Chthoniobacter sp.]